MEGFQDRKKKEESELFRENARCKIRHMKDKVEGIRIQGRKYRKRNDRKTRRVCKETDK